jgi:hypothetical protein
MRPILLLLLSLLLVSSSCNKPEDDKYVADALVFGTYHGMCASNCVDMYEIRYSTMAKDDSVKYTDLTWNYTFKTYRLIAKTKQQIAVQLLSEVPKELFANGATTYGSPDSHDQGGVYLEVKSIPGNYKFKLDMDDTPDQSDEVKAFKQKVLTVLRQIQ